MSTLETQPNERCYNRKVDGEDYCDKHREHPNLGARLRAYVAQVGGLRAFAKNYKALLEEFFGEEYPATGAERPEVAPVMHDLIEEARS